MVGTSRFSTIPALLGALTTTNVLGFRWFRHNTLSAVLFLHPTSGPLSAQPAVITRSEAPPWGSRGRLFVLARNKPEMPLFRGLDQIRFCYGRSQVLVSPAEAASCRLKHNANAELKLGSTGPQNGYRWAL